MAIASIMTFHRTVLSAWARRAKEPRDERWLGPVKGLALVVFVSLPIFSWLAQPLAGRVVWTIAVASLPLFIVLVGYHRWRKICPLAFFAQLPARLGYGGKRRASQKFENVYYYFCFGVFFFSLWLRLIAINGDGRAITIFFVLISGTALTFGATFTGKTWCNYVCPVSFIEKIYTEPRGLRETENSQCAKCTACKKSCPDINQENGYWKEIASHRKRVAYFAFPGLVFGFYFYYFLQAGSWDYYFGGGWTNEALPLLELFLPGTDAKTAGFFFLPVVPRAVASILTLALFALVSFGFFSLLEIRVGKWLRQPAEQTDETRARHVVFTIAAFAAFVTFYTFAGAPTLRRLPTIIPHLFLIAVVLTATLFLVRRLRRSQQDFAEETLARNILKRWEWTDMAPPKDLQAAFLIHQARSREQAKAAEQVLEYYKDAVREALADGYVTREDVQRLDALRSKLRIKNRDHERVMAALAEEERELLSDPVRQLSAEKRLQLGAYRRALESYFERALDARSDADDSVLSGLREQYRVTKEEHERMLDQVLGGTKEMSSLLAEQVKSVEYMALAIQALDRYRSPASDCLREILERGRSRTVGRLLRGLGFWQMEQDIPDDVCEALMTRDDMLHVAVVEELRTSGAGPMAERLIAAHQDMVVLRGAPPAISELLWAQLHGADPYIRAATLYVLHERGEICQETLASMSQDEHEFVRNTAAGLWRSKTKAGAGSANKQDPLVAPAMTEECGERSESIAGEPLLEIEKMIALRNASLFARLAPESLAELARASREESYGPDMSLCLEDEEGNQVFTIVAGEVKVMRREGNIQKIIGTEGIGASIGEMAILDQAPRAATVIAGKKGARVLTLEGAAFRQAMSEDPSIAFGVIRTLAQRLRNPGHGS